MKKYQCDYVIGNKNNNKACLAEFIEDDVRCEHCPYNQNNYFIDNTGQQKPKRGILFDI